MDSNNIKAGNQSENKNKNSNFNSNEKVSLKREKPISHRGSFTKVKNKNKNLSPSDPEFSWLHDTLQGKKVLSSLSDAFYMD